jgi:hypothetical protein
MLELPAGVEAVQLGHTYIQDNNVRLQSGRSFQQRPAIAHRTHDLAARLDYALQCLRQHLMVVRQ